MRYLMNMLLFALLSAGTLLAQSSPQLLFDQANTLLDEAKYQEAMEIYHRIENSGSVSGPLYLNMGIASAEIDSMGLAKYYFLKASKFDLTEDRAMDALEYVQAQFSRQSATLPKLPWDKAVDRLKEGPGPEGVFIIGFLLVLTAFTLIILHWFRIYTVKRYTGTILTLLVLSISVLGLSFYVDYVDQRYSEGVITTREVQVKQRPSGEADLVSLAYEGYSVTVDERNSRQHENWLFIRLGNGQFGWIPDEGVNVF